MNRTWCFCISLCLGSIIISAQHMSEIQITYKGDRVVQGTTSPLAYRNVSDLSEYKDTKGRTHKIITPDVKVLSITSLGEFYPFEVNVDGTKQWRFFQLLNDGPLQLFVWQDGAKERLFIMSKEASTPQELLKKVEDEGNIRKTSFPFRRSLIAAMIDQPDLHKRIESTPLKREKISDLVHTYNQRSSPSASRLNKSFKLDFDMTAGLRYHLTTRFDNNVNTNLLHPSQYGFDILVVQHNPFKSRISSFNYGITYRTASYTVENVDDFTFKQSNIALPIFLRINDRYAIISPKIDLGFAFNLYSHSSTDNPDRVVEDWPEMNLNERFILNLGFAINPMPQLSTSFNWSPLGGFMIGLDSRF